MVASVAIFRNQRPTILGVEVDIRTSERHNAENDITELVLEDGSRVTDHVIIRPDVIEVTVSISNYDGPATGTDGVGSSLEGERARTTWAALKAIRNSREVVSVQTHHELYDNVVIESLQAEHLSPYRGAMNVTIGLKAIDTAQLSVVQIPEDSLQSTGENAISKSASSEVDNGSAAPVTQESNPSLLERLLGGG
jgi:hypothetical protein